MKRLFFATLAMIFSVHATAELTPAFTQSAKGNDTWINIQVNPVSGKNIDVLFVVDDSGSMGPYQKNLSEAAPLFAQTIGSNQALTHVGVVTTTVNSTYGLNYPTNGQFISGILKSDSPTFVTDLEKSLIPGVNGDATEKIFGAIFNALSEPKLSVENAGFLRPDADLFIVILTDTADQSSIKAEALANHLINLKGNNSVSVLAALPPANDSKCPPEYGSNPSGTVAIESLVNLTGGSVLNICGDFASNFSQALVSNMVFESHINLPSPEKMDIDYSTIIVKLGGKVLVIGDLQNGWVFDSTAKQVVLSQGALKKAATQGPITISYKVL